MDTLRGNFAERADELDDASDYDVGEEDTGHDAPPPGIGQDERRMQVRAYNHWAGLLEDRNYPAIEDLEPEKLTDFGPYSVLLDFTNGVDNPGISYLGDKLAAECDTDTEIETLADVPSRSLLSRITDHYMQILANQAPIGFEAEFVNQRGATILYRGILLPFSSDDDAIDFIYGVINWKEMADQQATEDLLLQIDQALNASALLADSEDTEAPSPLVVASEDGGAKEIRDPFAAIAKRAEAEIGDWADGPAANDFGSADDASADVAPEALDEDASDEDTLAEDMGHADEPAAGPTGDEAYGVLDLGSFDADEDGDAEALPRPSFGLNINWNEEAGEPSLAGNMFASMIRKPENPPTVTLDGTILPPAGDEDFGTEARPAPSDAPPAPGFGDGGENEDAILDLAQEELVAGRDTPTLPEADAGFPEDAAAEGVQDAGFAEAAPALAAEPADDLVEPEGLLPPEAAAIDIVPPGSDEEELGLYDTLASARALAQTAINSEDRSRAALYDAIGKAYDFSLAAEAEPEEFEDLLAESGLERQDRAPLTPLVKLVFGIDYDKTRITEYATALGHARRLQLDRGELPAFLRQAEGGLKGVVAEERRLRREENGESVEQRHEVRKAVARRLRKIEPQTLEALDSAGEEFALVMIRRTPAGEVLLLGEVPHEVTLVEKAARKLLAP